MSQQPNFWQKYCKPTRLFYSLESNDVVQCNVTLHQMDKDYNDFIPSLRAYSDGDSDMDTARICFFYSTCYMQEVQSFSRLLQ